MRLGSHLLLGLGLALAQAAFAPPTYPDWPTTKTKAAEPPKAEVVDQLPAGRLYVVQHNAEACQLLVSPPGVASVREYTGAVTIDGLFADGSDFTETRDYKAKQVFVVKRLQPGPFELLKVPAGALERRVLSDPKVTPAPDPKPVDPPVPVVKSPWDNAEGLRVLFVYPSGSNLPPAQDSIIYGKRVRDYLESHCVKLGTDPQYAIWPSNADLSSVGADWKRAFALSGGKPWVVIGSGAKWESVPLPSNPDEALKLLKKYGGE